MKLLKVGASRAVDLAAAVWGEISETAVAVFQLPVDVIVLRGRLRGSSQEEEVTLLYVGRGLNLAHIKGRCFTEVAAIKSKRTNLLSYRKHMKAAQTDADVTFVDIGWPYSERINKKGDYLELPDWVCMVTPLAETWECTVQKFRKTMRKNIGRQIRRNGYRCEATNDPDLIKSFYDDYYRAFINSRFDGGEVVMTPRAQVEKCARIGVILRVIGPDGPVAAGVYFPRGEEFCLMVSGMPEALLDNPPEAAISALYFFSLQYAFEQSYKAVNFLGTRAFPDDGLFQFKRKWGAEIKDSFSVDSILFKPAKNNAKAVRFCELFPVIARQGEELELVICTRAQDLTADACDRLVGRSHCGGVQSARIVHVSDLPAGSDLPSPTQHPTARVVRTPLDSFAQSYAGDVPMTAKDGSVSNRPRQNHGANPQNGLAYLESNVSTR